MFQALPDHEFQILARVSVVRWVSARSPQLERNQAPDQWLPGFMTGLTQFYFDANFIARHSDSLDNRA